MQETRHSQHRELQARYETLVKSHRAAFERLARRLARDPEDAEDLLQETLLDAYRAFARFRPNSHFYSWVARIMTNNYLDRVRRKQCPVVSLEQPDGADGLETIEVPDESSSPERVVLWDEMDHSYASALAALQPLQRATVLLCDIEGATYEEAAREEACPIGTIRSRLHRAHRSLREFLTSLTSTAQSDRLDPSAARVQSRRAFLRMGASAAAAAGAAALAPLAPGDASAAEPPVIRVLIWASPSEPSAVYPEGVAAALADALRPDPRFEVRIAAVRDPDTALSDDELGDTDVLVWWGDRTDLREDRVSAIVRRVRRGGMGFIAAHGAQESRLLGALLGGACGWTEAPHPDGTAVALRVTAPRHPIAAGVSAFTIPGTQRCSGEFDGRKPDVVVFDGTYPASGHSAWQGMVWRVGDGRVFYFVPGHPEHAVYAQDEVRRVLLNAAAWCAGR